LSGFSIGWKQLNQYHLALGEVMLLHSVRLIKTHPLDRLHLALGRAPLSRQTWMVVTDEPATLQTFREYGQRFQIEEELLDEEFNGFQLERSEIRCAPALSRLCFVMAVATLLLTVQGQQVVATGKRRSCRLSLATRQQLSELGWNWLKGVLHQG